jgi:hypothetical protein
VEITAVDGEPGSIFEMQPSLAFGRAGGLLVWQLRNESNQAWARPLDFDGRPTAPAMTFPTPDGFVMDRLVAFEGGFAAFYGVPDVAPHPEHHYLQLLGPGGEPRRGPVKLALDDFRWSTVSEAAGNRFLVFGGPNSATGQRGSRVLLLTLDAGGNVAQQKVDVPISAPATVSPAVSIALDEKRWAVTVRVAAEVPGEMFVFDPRGRRPAAPPTGGKGSRGPVGGTESLIVDGVMRPIHADQAAAAGALAAEERYQIAWKGDALAVTWATGERGARRPRFGSLALDGQLHVETTSEGEKAIRAAFEEQISATQSDEDNALSIVRETRWGAPVGEATRLDGTLPDVAADMLGLDVIWSGSRFVIAYAPNVDGTVHLRAVGMRCDGEAKAP